MIGDGVLFRFESIQDSHDADQVIANADQGGLGLPDRDYYLKDDPSRSNCAKPISRTCRRCSNSWATSPKPPPRRRKP